MCFLDPYPTSSNIQLKRAVARRIGTTFAYDFLGLMKVSLIKVRRSRSGRGGSGALS